VVKSLPGTPALGLRAVKRRPFCFTEMTPKTELLASITSCILYVSEPQLMIRILFLLLPMEPRLATFGGPI
jgi:hypothetical protein